jgi:Protein of unknown function (DUF1524)
VVDEEFKKAFEIATVSKAAFARYYLRSLEMAAKNKTTPWFIPNDDRQTINLEHVLPEQREGNWPQFDEETAKIYIKKIGNLALLLAKSNSDLKSSDFKSKKAVYKRSPYELTRMISKASDWTKDSIAARQKAQGRTFSPPLASMIVASSLGVWSVAMSPTSFARAIGSVGRFGFLGFHGPMLAGVRR